MYPVYKGTFERGIDFPPSFFKDVNSHQYSEFMVKCVKDFERSMDYLETRQDIDSHRIAYFGYSWGGKLGAIIPAVETRLQASILVLGGLYTLERPEANQITYVTRVKIPTLMLNGKYDLTFPFERSARPMFDLLGHRKNKKSLSYMIRITTFPAMSSLKKP